MKEYEEVEKQGASGEKVKKALSEVSEDGTLSCAAAIQVAEEMKIQTELVGDYADELGLHLVKCQLGLFGHSPEKKLVKPLESVDGDLEAAIRRGLVNGRLSCKRAWEIADSLNISRMRVSAACESLGIKIKPCQIGAF